MIIRPAVEADIPEIVSIGETIMTGEMAALEILHERKHVEAHVRAFVGKEWRAAFVAEADGAVVGFILVSASQSGLSSEIVARKSSWMMLSKYRGHGTALLRQAEKWAASKGATTFFVSLPDSTPHVAMQRLGYKRIEVAYERKLVPQEQPKKADT